MASNKTAASAAVAASDSSSGKLWLRGLILRAEEVLGKMIYKLERTPITEEEIVAMANSVHPLVARWEKPLEDIRLELLDIPGVGGVDQGKPKEEQQEHEGKMERSGLLALKEEEIRLIRLHGGDRPAEPSFKFPEQSLENLPLGAAATATRPFCPFNNGSDESNCASGAHSKGDPIPPPVPTGWQQRKQIVPPIGCHLMLVPKFIRDVGHMWCWVVKAGYIDPDFHEMELRMNDPEYSLQYRKFRGQPKMNDRAFARYTDKRWYRTEVVNYFDERNVRVFYVDYGNCEMVTMDEIRHWDDRFSYLPYQVKLCKLSNLKPVKKIHPQAVIELNRKLLNKRVRAEIVNNSVPWEIIMFDEDRFDISHGLLLTGLAKKIKEDNGPDPTQEAPGA